MRSLCSLLFLFCVAFWVQLTFAHPNNDTTTDNEILERDVVVIGGGSSGTYTAVRLQQMGKSVALVEKEKRLGGHVNTYVDPATKKTFDYGVIVLVNITVVRDYFQYLGIPLTAYTGFTANQTTSYVDIAAGLPAPEMNDSSLPAAVLNYHEELQRFPYLDSGFHLPDPVPEDLLIPYGEYLAKYNLSALAYTAFYIDEGVGNILEQPTLYMLKLFSDLQVQGLATGFVNANNNYQALYDSALKRLGDNSNVFLRSHLETIKRNSTGVEVQLNTGSCKKTVRAKKLVMAIPPLVPALSPFLSLTLDEYTLFQQFNHSYLWVAIVRNTGIPSNMAIENTDVHAPNGIPSMPATYAIVPSATGNVHAMWYGSTTNLSIAQVQKSMLDAIYQVQKAKNYVSPRGASPHIVELHNHSPYELTVSVDVINDRFYDKANALQGQANTFWTGAAWESHDSSAIWNFTEYEVLPKLVRSLG